MVIGIFIKLIVVSTLAKRKRFIIDFPLVKTGKRVGLVNRSTIQSILLRYLPSIHKMEVDNNSSYLALLLT
jgi:hypothetical protein